MVEREDLKRIEKAIESISTKMDFILTTLLTPTIERINNNKVRPPSQRGGGGGAKRERSKDCDRNKLRDEACSVMFSGDRVQNMPRSEIYAMFSAYGDIKEPYRPWFDGKRHVNRVIFTSVEGYDVCLEAKDYILANHGVLCEVYDAERYEQKKKR